MGDYIEGTGSLDHSQFGLMPGEDTIPCPFAALVFVAFRT